MTEEEVVRALAELPGVVTVTASESNGAPEVAWGDSFFFYDPDGADPGHRRLPFATVVTKDYPGFDVASNLNRPGVFRLNLAVGRARFEELFGFPPAELASHESDVDFSVLDQVVPHPVYAKQGWVCVVVPGQHTAETVRELIGHAWERAKDHYRRR